MTIQEVKKVAKLARLELTAAELKKYADQLSQILKYVDQLNDIDTQNIEITTRVTGLTNVFREDRKEECEVVDALLAQAPEVVKRGVKVKKVF